MGKIRILSDNLVSKIAAGEIVERPASVVKELLENSIDAGSSFIEIELESGGKKLIRVSDDGEGMTRDESLLSLERHATSKIKDIDDLFSVSSLGFRGEAIPSIASVSRFKITTRTPDDIIGIVIRVEGGFVKNVEETGAPRGTIVEVRDLFYNTPPRMKFMRKTETELSNVIDIVEREAIPRPGVGFELKHGGRTLLRLARRENAYDRIKEIYPRAELFQIRGEAEGIRVSGFLGSPLDTRSTTQKLYTYVNGRSVRDRFLIRMVIDSYGKMLEKGKFPQGVLFLDLPAGGVDVNVHPTKNEVRFQNVRLIGDLIKESVTGMLEGAPWLRSYRDSAEEPASGFRSAGESKSRYGGYNFDHSEIAEAGSGVRPGMPHADMHTSGTTGEIQAPGSRVGTEDIPASGLFEEQGTYSSLRILGQLGELYIVCASRHGIILVDQHAAHERINYERLKKAYTGNGGLDTQELLVPEVLELSPFETDLLRGNKEDLRILGIRIEEFGDNAFILRSVPAILKNSNFPGLIKDVVNEIAESGRQESLSERIDRVISTMACHSSVRASNELNTDKMKALLVELDRTEFPHSCPHGRPVARELTYGEIERMFKRT
ncbi:MAG: DNA mismatch repair endonuclease MutL [Deltaproteobacteria bacterium]